MSEFNPRSTSNARGRFSGEWRLGDAAVGTRGGTVVALNLNGTCPSRQTGTQLSASNAKVLLFGVDSAPMRARACLY